MWPFDSGCCHKKRMSDDEIIASLKPGDRWKYTSGPAGVVIYYGVACDICGKEFQYQANASSNGFHIYPVGAYWYQDFGKYKPTRMWYCRSHSNKEIEIKIKELDI